MNWWTVLEISYDSDLKTIKRAYAKLLKVYNPEDDAKGYQTLREAYDKAVKYVKKNDKNQNNQEIITDNPAENIVREENSNESEINKTQNESRADSYIDYINNEGNNTENEVNEDKQNKSRVDAYIDYINNEGNNTENEVNEDKKNKSRADAYIDYINNEGNNTENEVNEDKKNKSRVDAYIDYINNEGNNAENEVNENKQIKFKANSHIEDIYNEEQDVKTNLNEQINEFLNRLNQIYNDMSLRINTKAWEELLNSDVIWNVYSFPIIEDEIFKFLIDHKYLPSSVLAILNNNFNWSKNEIELYEKYSKDIVDELLKNSKNPNKLKYDYLVSINSDIADEYLHERQKAYESLENKVYYKADKHLTYAYSLFSYDPELLRLIGNYNYEFKKFDKALEFYKAAFKINNYDLESALCIGIILVADERFSEALSYLELYLSFNKNDKLALNNIAYCYYYNNNLSMAKQSFQSVLFYGGPKIIEKYLKNIESQLEGKHVRTIKFNKDNSIIKKMVENELNEKKVAKEEPKIQKTESLDIKSIIKTIVYILIIISTLGRAFGHKDTVTKNNDNNNEVSDIQKALKEDVKAKTQEEIKDDENFKAINTGIDYYNIPFFMNIKLYLKDVKPIEYYKLSEAFNDKVILSKAEIDNNNLQNKIESQLFMGTFNDYNIIFADNNYTIDAVDKNNGYIVKGALCNLEAKVFDDIKAKTHTKGYFGLKSQYIDCSQKEIERVKKENESIEMHGKKFVKKCKTMKDFQENINSSVSIYSLHLTNIMPLDYYATGIKNGKLMYLKKSELNQNDLADYTQAFVGQFDGKNIMIVDRNFSMKDVDKNRECTVYSEKLSFAENANLSIPVEQGQNVDTVNIKSDILYNLY